MAPFPAGLDDCLTAYTAILEPGSAEPFSRGWLSFAGDCGSTPVSMGTAGSTLSEKVALGPRPIVDFNPAADRLRVIGADGVSLRINVENGATTIDKPLNYDATDAAKDKDKTKGKG